MAQRTVKRTTTRSALTSKKPWRGTLEVLDDVHSVLSKFDQNAIDDVEARVYNGAFRTVVGILKLSLEFMRLTGGLNNTSTGLRGVPLLEKPAK